MSQKVFIFRHAERENTGTDNPPLSLRGHSQALALVRMINERSFAKPTRLFCSPKLRAVQTLFPCAQSFSLPLTERRELDERQTTENASQFSQRIQTQLSWLESSGGHSQSPVTFVVSHLDWIEEALTFIPSDTDLLKTEYQAWSPLQFLGFEISDGLWKLSQQGRVE